MAVSPALNSVLLALPGLSLEELQIVRTRAGASASLSRPGRRTEERQERPSDDYILEGIHQELRKRGLLRGGKRLPPQVIPSTYPEASAGVRAHFEEYLGRLPAQEYAALGQLMAEALARWLIKRGKPVAAWSFLAHVPQIPPAVDDAFPDYLESGLLASCWRK